jgi:hypothetical protein
MKVKNIKNAVKAKVVAKVAKAKNKVAAKCSGGRCSPCSGGKCKPCVIAVALALALLAGCHMGELPTAQRAQTSYVRDNVFNVYVMPPSTNAIAKVDDSYVPAIHVEVGNQAQANETSGTETMTSSPSNTPTVSTPVQVDARYNDAIAGATAASKGVLETLTDAGCEAVLKLMQSKETGTVNVTKKDGTTAVVQCADGQCSICEECTP